MGTVEFLGEVKHLIAKLDLRLDEAALLVHMEPQQLERMLSFPELAPTLRPMLQLLDDLGLGIVGIEPLSTAMVIRYLDRCREAKKVTKSDLAARADVNRTHLTYMFQHADPDPKLETVFKLAAALDCDLKLEQRRVITRPTAAVSHPANPETAATTATPTASLPTASTTTATSTPATPSPTTTSTPATNPTTKPPPTAAALPTPSPGATNTSPTAASPPPSTSATTSSAPSTRAAPSLASPSPQPSAPTSSASSTRAAPQPSAQTSSTSPHSSAPPPANGTTPQNRSSSTSTSNPPTSSTGPLARPSAPPAGTTPPSNAASGSTSHTPTSSPGPSARPTTTTTSAGAPNSAASNPTSATSRPSGASSRPTIPVGSPSDPWAFVTSSTSPGTQPRAPAPSPAPPSQPASTTAPPHLDPATNPALAHVFERLAQAREHAELDAQQAKFDLERTRLQHEHERQLAARGAAERALAKQEAHQTTVAVGGTAATAVLAGAATLALQQPENRRTAQAVMSIGGGALTAAAALADEGSTTRKVLVTAGLVTAGVAAFDYLRQVFSESRGGIGVTFHDRQDALVIKTVRPLSAAAVAGLIAGDELVEVDGLPVAQLGRSEAIRRLRGPIGSPIALSVRRPTTSNFEWKLTLIRTPL